MNKYFLFRNKKHLEFNEQNETNARECAIEFENQQ